MPKTPKRLFGPAALTNATATKYTVPALTKTVIRHIHYTNPSGASINLTVSIGADAAGTRVYDAYPVPAGSVVDVYPGYVLDVGETIAAFASTTGVVVMVIDGDEYTLG